MIDVATRVILRPCSDEQNANGCGDDRHVEHFRVRKPATEAYRLCALEQVVVSVVEQFPRQRQQERGCFFGGLEISIRSVGFRSSVHVYRKTTAGVITNP